MHRPQRAGDEAADEITEAGEFGAGDLADHEHDHVVQQQQRDHVQDLVLHREPQHAPVQHDAGESEHRVGERVLAEQAAVGDIHQQPHQPRRGKADLARLLNAPVEHGQRDEIRLDREQPARPRQQIDDQRRDQREDDERRLDRQQDFVRCDVARLHQLPRAFSGARRLVFGGGRRRRACFPSSGPAPGRGWRRRRAACR